MTTKKKTPKVPRKFTLTKVIRKFPIGQTLYECVKTDFGAALQDEQYFKEKYNVAHYPVMSVTLREDGDWPCFTVPVNALKEVKQPLSTTVDKNEGK